MNGYLPEGCGVKLYVPHENFHRDIGAFGGSATQTEICLKVRRYEEYAVLRTVLPTPEDEEALKELFKQQWIQDKPLTPRQLASGIGATAWCDLIPVSLYGADEAELERFYSVLHWIS